MQASQIIKSEDAGAELAELVDRVEHGQCIVVTRGGVPVARIVSAAEDSTASDDVLERARARRKKMRDEGRSIGVQDLLKTQDRERR